MISNNTQTYSSKSIAVLPFVNMSNDDENEYFSDGITEEIINALSKISGLKVIARTSSFVFKNKAIDIRKIGNELGVNTILEGSVRKANKRVRITAQLVRTDDGSQLWSENFDRELEDIFALQDEISLLISDHIRENFGHLDITESLIETQDISPECYQLYLKGKYYLNRFNAENIKLGISILQEVVRQKPDYALAHVKIHYGYNCMAAGGLMPVKEALAIGKKHLDLSFQYDDKLPEYYHSMGWHALNADWDFTSATKNLMKAIALRPGYADGHQKLFINLALEGNLELAHKHISIAYELDPLEPLNNYFTAYYYYLVGDFKQSNQYMERTFELDASFMVGYSIYALSLVMQNRGDYILEKAETIPPVHGADIEKLIMQALAHSSMSNLNIAKQRIKTLHAFLNGESRERVRFFLIYVECILGNHETALDLVDESLVNREPLMTLLKVDPLLKPLHKYDRFKKALKEIFALSEVHDAVLVSTKHKEPNASEIEIYLQRLENHMTSEMPYTDNSLSLRKLAKDIDITANKLSWLINKKIGKNFNEYINLLRLETFKQMAVDPKHSQLTLLGIAYESGFNSKSVFNDFFKKLEGVTPREWVKSRLK